MKLAAVVTALILSSGCNAAATPAPSASAASAAASSSATLGTPSPGHLGARLIVLADGIGGGVGLWALDAQSHWVALGATPAATALGRATTGVVIATGHLVEVRPISDLVHTGRVTTLKWPGTSPTAPVEGLDTSPSGKLAVVTADGGGLAYAVAGVDGTVATIRPAPTQSFSPLVAWLDDSRLVVLDTDRFQASRLGVVDTSVHSISTAEALAGVRVFALSSDRQMIAVATERAAYVGPVETFLGGTLPGATITLGDSEVTWALALDATGSRLFLLSGAMASDGRISSIREVGYSRQDSGWAKVLDLPAPFQRAIGQVYLD